MRVDIKTYLETNELSQEEFARQLGVSQGLVWQWLDGRTKLTVEKVRHIVSKTNGDITPHDLMPRTFPPGFEFPPEEARA